ncbi:MAG: DUF192 domain-containing protein [Candidatus Omnitrophota bacterium]
MLKIKKILFFWLALLLLIIGAALLPVRPVIVKNKIILVEIARTPQQSARGLQGRKSLGKDSGMLFIFQQERYVKFWMKDTSIPLSIAFIDRKKTIVDIQQMEPLQTAVQYPSAEKSKYALEMNSGWFKNNNIAAGDRMFFWP